MDMTEYFDMMIKVGRVPYKINFAYDSYLNDDNNWRMVVPKDQANCWSSHSRLARAEGYHLPVFDVDKPKNTLVPIWNNGVLNPVLNPASTVQAQCITEVVKNCFPEAKAHWVPSTTPGHFHVYVDYPILWPSYFARLAGLSAAGVIEPGYLNTAQRRGATFVRMPGVLKEGFKHAPPTMVESAIDWSHLNQLSRDMAKRMEENLLKQITDPTF